MTKVRTFGIAVASAAAAASLTLTGQAVAGLGHAHGHGTAIHARAEVQPPPLHPKSDKQIQNIDQVKTAIKGYYGDTPTAVPDPVDGSQLLHTFDPNGAYAKQVMGIVDDAKTFLGAKNPHANPHRAIVLDVDDTSLNTYNYEIYSNFVYNFTTNSAFVNAEAFPAVPGMPDLASYAVSKGYTLFFLTGRGGAQRAATEGNLANAGFPAVPDSQVFLKDYPNEPWLSSCAPSCTTIQYKSLTREHIESLGYKIVANFGDQKSDLKGGHAQRKVKMPNPMYFLP